MKKSIKVILTFTLGVIFGVSLLISYASTYNSEEISYDNSTSHASATNVKDAIDYLYSHGSCGSGMSCLENPVVTINSIGDGNISTSSLSIPITGSKKIIVTPANGYTLGDVSCTNGYVVSNWTVSRDEQEVTISNPGTVSGSVCQIRFDAQVELSISSSHTKGQGYDTCVSEGVGCVCWYINEYAVGFRESTNRGNKFNYNGHTGCLFKNYTCYQSTTKNTYSCELLYRSNSGANIWDLSDVWGGANCNATIACET